MSFVLGHGTPSPHPHSGESSGIPGGRRGYTRPRPVTGRLAVEGPAVVSRYRMVRRRTHPSSTGSRVLVCKSGVPSERDPPVVVVPRVKRSRRSSEVRDFPGLRPHTSRSSSFRVPSPVPRRSSPVRVHLSITSVPLVFPSPGPTDVVTGVVLMLFYFFREFTFRVEFFYRTLCISVLSQSFCGLYRLCYLYQREGQKVLTHKERNPDFLMCFSFFFFCHLIQGPRLRPALSVTPSRSPVSGCLLALPPPTGRRVARVPGVGSAGRSVRKGFIPDVGRRPLVSGSPRPVGRGHWDVWCLDGEAQGVGDGTTGVLHGRLTQCPFKGRSVQSLPPPNLSPLAGRFRGVEDPPTGSFPTVSGVVRPGP